MNRSPKAVLSPVELNALRRLAGGPSNLVPSEHREVLLSMGLVRINKAGRAKLTEESRLRLDESSQRSPYMTAAGREQVGGNQIADNRSRHTGD